MDEEMEYPIAGKGFGSICALSSRDCKIPYLLRPFLPDLLVKRLINKRCVNAEIFPLSGACLFLDVRGFTCMTESLSKYGTIGAEIIRDGRIS